MIFLPFRAAIRLTRIPVVTIVVSLICLAVYYAQSSGERRFLESALRVCHAHQEARGPAWDGHYLREGRAVHCVDALIGEYLRQRGGAGRLPGRVPPALSRAADEEQFREDYYAFARIAPGLLTARLWQPRPSFDPVTMITSSFAHGSWGHVIFNLFFFFAFAATVELIVGPILFVAVIALLSVGIGVIDSLQFVGQTGVPASLGLSGVVMGMLALFVYFVPRAKIRFFVWILLYVGTVGIPGWIVALFYVAGDAYANLVREPTNVNFVAHLAGAAMGLILGMTLFRSKRHWARELVEEVRDPHKETGFFGTLRTAFAAPFVVVGVAFGMVLVVTLVLYFVRSFWVQLLLLAPIALALWQIFRMRRSGRPDFQRYREALARLERGELAAARKALTALADAGYPRAQHTLGEMHATGRGVLKDPAAAARWFAQAARRGYGPAQFVLAQLHADGHGVARDEARARELYAQAAERGVAQAAFSLAHAYHHGVGVAADREAAARWYHRAGVLAFKEKNIADACMALSALNGLVPGHALTAELAAALRAAPAAPN
jgi:membrane associated rhomboid family serine protease